MWKLFFLICCTVLILNGCALEEKRNKNSLENTTNTNSFSIQNYASNRQEHTYFYKSHPQRIVALWQNSVETLIALGAGDKIIAAGGIANEKYLKPEHLQAFQKIPLKSRQVFSQEDVLLMKPDFILGWLFDFTGKARSIGTTDFWEKRSVNIYMNLMNGAEFKTKHVLEDEIKYIHDVGKIVDREKKAEEIVAGIQRVIQECKTEVNKKQNTPRVLIIAGMGKNISIYTPRTLPGDIIEKLGGETLGKNKEAIGENEFMSLEEVRLSEPDVVFISTVPELFAVSKQRFSELPGFKSMSCVKNGKVFCIPYYTIRSPGVRVSDAVKIFSDGLRQDG